jgi:hypothetical protein
METNNMSAHVLKGSKKELAEGLAQINGDVREAIVFVDDSAPSASGNPAVGTEDIFAEMRPFLVQAPDIDDSREAIYSRLKGE